MSETTTYQKPMVYVKRVACSDLSLGEFSVQYKALSSDDRATLAKWCDDEQRALGIAVPG